MTVFAYEFIFRSWLMCEKGVCAKVVITGTTGTENEKSYSTWRLDYFNNRFQIWLTK